MMRKAFLLIFCLPLLCFSYSSETVNVATAADLIGLFSSAKGSTVDVNIDIQEDLDFSRAGLILPLGANSSGACVSYSGVLHGNGHTIQGIAMNNRDKQPMFNHAGLFCSLKDAVIENLVIGSSCIFIGHHAGSLCVSVNGSLMMINVTNKASVTGHSSVGGFVGEARDLTKGVLVSFEKCVNEGKITGDGSVGGFIGYFYNNTNNRMTISSSMNSGIVTSMSDGAGGLIGYLSRNSGVGLEISRTTNNGIVTSASQVGGLVGHVGGDSESSTAMNIHGCANKGRVTGDSTVGGLVGVIASNVTMDISRCVNSGMIVGGKKGIVGGFVGEMQVSTSVKISASVNKQIVLGRGSYSAGLVGYASFDTSSSPATLSIINSENEDSISAGNGMACGLFCVDILCRNCLKSVVINSINKGNVGATIAYGISTTVTTARNVVSMGSVGSGPFTFWESSTDVGMLYGREDKCIGCPSHVALFNFNWNTGFYEVVKTGDHVQDLLNDAAQRGHYGMLWTPKLDLTDTKAQSF